MRQDIIDFLHEQGWTFSHETEDGRRIWCQLFDNPYTRAKVLRFDEEKHLVELAMEVVG